MNKVCIVGRLAKDPETRVFESGKSKTTFTVAANRKGKEAGADFIRCDAWDKTAAYVDKFCKKGQMVELSGSISVNNFKGTDGKWVNSTSVLVSEVKILAKAVGEQPQSFNPYESEQHMSTISAYQENGMYQDDLVQEEDLPF